MSEKFTCRFFDGKSLQPFTAAVEILPSGLSMLILENEKETPLLWSWHNVQVMEPPLEGRPAILGCKDMTGARLHISDPSHYQEILSYIPKKNIKLSNVSHPWRKLGILVVVIILLLGGLLLAIPKLSNVIANHFPDSWDDAFGQFLIKDIAKKNKECVSPDGLKALQKMVTKLSKGNPDQHQLDVKVIQLGPDNINAFAVPGYHLIILNGLLEFADSPDEVAGVLAHEMGHAIEHHPTQGVIRKVGIQLVLTGAFGSSAEYASNLLHLKYTREDEQRADDIAVELLNKANISTKGLVSFFEKLTQQYNLLAEHEEVLEYFSDHPGLMERIHRIEAVNKPQDNTQPSLSPQEWKALKNICSKTAPLEFKEK